MASDRFDADAPVTVFDRLTVLPGCQREVLRRIEDEYRPLAAERGLRHLGTWTLPPFDRPGDSSDILARWEYPSLGALWIARGPEETDHRLSRFWTGLETLLVSRSRQLGRPRLIDGMAPPGDKPTIFRRDAGRSIAFVRPGAAVDPVSALPLIEAGGARAGVNDGGHTFRPGELTIDAATYPGDLAEFGRIEDVVRLGRNIETGFRDPALGHGVKRTILLRTIAGTDAARIDLLERRLGEWARHLPELVNWCLSRVASTTGAVAWTHCFEQEFADVAQITGAYLNHPFHWAVIDRFFHPEAPERIADAFFQTIYPVRRSVLAELAGPTCGPMTILNDQEHT